jgi:predicted extracellular nuclease
MRRTAILVFVLGLIVATAAFAAQPVRISQVYGGGGNSGAYYRYDYVELFNTSGAAIDIGGWAIVYATSTSGTFGSASNYRVVFPAGATIPACGYYLIQNASGSNSAAAPLPVAPDVTGTIAMSATACKIGLISSGTSANCSTPFVDLVAVGASTQCWEGAGPTGATSNTKAAVRKQGGMQDTDNNSTDFLILDCNASLPIHSSMSPTNPECEIIPTVPETWGRLKIIYR